MTDTPPDALMPFLAMDILKKARALEARGRTICHLEVGEPGQPPAPRVIEAVARALPQPQGYTNAKGMTELREGLAHYYEQQHGVAVDPELILATMGSSAGFILAFHTAFRPGARIAITRPGYPAYVNTLLGLGFAIAEIPVSAANGWHLTGADIARAHAQNPFDGLLFASPANPTGAVIPRDSLAELLGAAAERGIAVISDEIYHRLCYTGPDCTALSIDPNVVVINSFSKYYCMTGWRVGWMVLPQRLVRQVERLAQSLYISAPEISQAAAVHAFDASEELDAVKRRYEANRELLLDRLPALGMPIAAPMDGAFYAYCDVTRHTNDSMEFARAMLAECHVAATPGRDFDTRQGHRFMRFSYAGSTSQVQAALDRLSGWLKP